MSTASRKKEVETMRKASQKTQSPVTEKEQQRLDAAARLQQARLLAGYGTAVEGSKAVGVNDRSYAQYENGKRGYKSKVIQFAKVFNVRAEWLLTGEEPMSPAAAAQPPQPQLQPESGGATASAPNAENTNPFFELFARKMGGDTIADFGETDLISISFAAAAEFDKMALGGKGSLKDVIKVAEQIYKIAQMKAKDGNNKQ